MHRANDEPDGRAARGASGRPVAPQQPENDAWCPQLARIPAHGSAGSRAKPAARDRRDNRASQAHADAMYDAGAPRGESSQPAGLPGRGDDARRGIPVLIEHEARGRDAARQREQRVRGAARQTLQAAEALLQTLQAPPP